MTIRDIMTKEVRTIDAGATLTEAAKAMDDFNIGALPVFQDQKLLGIITDRDLVIRSISAGQDPNRVAVRDTMTAPAITCFEDQSIEELARIFKLNQVRRVPVLDRQRELVGIITVDDVARKSRDEKATVDILRAVSEVAEKRAA